MITTYNTLLCSGYWHPHRMDYEAEQFHHLWLENLKRYLPEMPRIYLMPNGGCMPPVNCDISKTFISGNPGHVGDLLNGTKKHHLCGWSSIMLALAMIAYNEERNFLYVEQDCLVFGKEWLDELARELGGKSFIFGKKMESPPWMASAQSLFLVRHSYIPTFIQKYLSMPWDGDPEWLPETKFLRIMESDWDHCQMMTWGVDRERPLPYEAPYWYAQKFTKEELAELKKRNLL